MSLGKILWRIGLVACTHKMTGNRAPPHFDPAIFEPLWNANSLGSLVRLAVSALYGLLVG